MCSASSNWARSSRLVPLLVVLLQQGPHRVDEFAAAPVADRHVDHETVEVRCLLGDGLERGCEVVGQKVQRTDGLDPPMSVFGQVMGGLVDDAEQGQQLRRVPLQVVGGQQPQGDHLDAGFLAPTQELRDPRRAGTVAGLAAGALDGGPPAVAVQDDPDMAGGPVAVQPPPDPTGVGGVEDVAQTHEHHLRLIPSSEASGACCGRARRRP